MDDTQTTSRSRELRNQGTSVERILWQKLRSKQLDGVKFRRQQPVGNYIIDFVSFEIRLIIEIDGGQHNDKANEKKDAIRTNWLKHQGYQVVRFWNNEVTENLEGVLHKIKTMIRNSSPSPSYSSPIKGEESGREGGSPERGQNRPELLKEKQ